MLNNNIIEKFILKPKKFNTQKKKKLTIHFKKVKLNFFKKYSLIIKIILKFLLNKLFS